MFLELQQQSLHIGRKSQGFKEYYYTVWDDGLGREKVTLFLLLGIQSTQVPGAELGQEAFQRLQDHFLHDLQGDPYDRFENALREINILFAEKEKELELKFIPNVHVVAGVIHQDQLLLSQRGDARGYLVRKRHMSVITDQLFDPKDKDELFQNIASGVLEVGDSLVFTTASLTEYMKSSELSKIYSESSVFEANEGLQTLLKGTLEDQILLMSLEVLEALKPIKKSEIPKKEEVLEEEDVNLPKMTAQKTDLKTRMEALASLRRWALEQELAKKKWFLPTVGALSLVLVLSLFLLNRSGNDQARLEELQAQLDAAEATVDQAATQGTFDKVLAQELLADAEQMASGVLDAGLLGPEATALLDRIDLERDRLDVVTVVDDRVTELVDFSSLIGTGALRGLAPLEEEWIVFSETEIFTVLIDEVESPTVVEAGTSLKAGVYFDDQENIVLLGSDAQVLEYEAGNLQLMDTSDVEWASGVDVDTYSSRIYVLDPSSAQIWRYQRGSAGYGSAQAYVDEAPALAEAVSMAIDGSVWVLTKGGDVLKYLSGDEIDSDLVDAPLVPMTGATRIWTTLTENQVYILDPAESRLLLFDKSTRSDDLTYTQQYVFNDLKGTLQDFYVDRDRNVIMLVTDRALYQLSF